MLPPCAGEDRPAPSPSRNPFLSPGLPLSSPVWYSTSYPLSEPQAVLCFQNPMSSFCLSSRKGPCGLLPFGVPLLREGGPVPCRLAWGASLVWFSASLRPPLAARRSPGRGLAGCRAEGGSAQGWPCCVLGGTCWVPVPRPRCPTPAPLLWDSELVKQNPLRLRSFGRYPGTPRDRFSSKPCCSGL